MRIPTDRQGVVVTKIARNSPALRVGMRPGDIILELNGEQIIDAEQFAKLVNARPLFWKFKLDRGGQIIRQYLR